VAGGDGEEVERKWGGEERKQMLLPLQVKTL
jgi:hypothetical protein